MTHSISLQPGCRVEVRALPSDQKSPSAGALFAWAEPAGDGRWLMSHCDGRHVVVDTTVEVLERMIGVACDASLAEHWRRMAGQLPAGSERASTLLECAQELSGAAGQPSSGCCRGRALPELEAKNS